MLSYYEAPRCRLCYQDQGSGTPLVLIHGWCMSSDVWGQQVEGLSELFRVITVDLPGHGKSSSRAGGFSIQGSAEAIAELCVHLDLQNALLAGWSLGAQIAVAAFPLLRDSLSGLVLTSATPRFTRADDYPHGLSQAEADGMAHKVRRSIRRARDGFSALMFTSTELQNTEQAEQIRDLLDSVPLPETAVALQALQSLVDADIRNSLALIDLPTLIIHGDKDVICLPGASSFMADRIPLATMISFADCGHAPFLTQPNRFNSCLKNFAESVSGRQ